MLKADFRPLTAQDYHSVKQTFESHLLPGLKVRVAKIFQR